MHLQTLGFLDYSLTILLNFEYTPNAMHIPTTYAETAFHGDS